MSYSSAAKRHRVALAFPQGLSFIERILHGTFVYASEHGRWSFIRMPEMLTPSVDWLRYCKADGALALITTDADAKIARSLPFPVVNLAAHFAPNDIPSVMVDHWKIGQAAAQHLRSLGFTRFGYYGVRGRWYSGQRHAGFVATASSPQSSCRTLLSSAMVRVSSKWLDQQSELGRWLRTLKPPVGILASNDQRARMVMDACAEIGWRVPGDVAIIGVDNDSILCELCSPTLSSVARSDHQVGAEAGALLDRLMSGGAWSRQPILIPPEGVVRRKSTEMIAIDDPVLAKAVAKLKDQLHENFGVERFVQECGFSRRHLEQRFRTALDCTPYEFLVKLRVERAKQMLTVTPRLSLTHIAAACGFNDLRRFRLVFQRLTGTMPKVWRASAGNRAK
jgi:LacI family transcriptional regulator